jgi:hypothetical protein
LGSRSQRPRPIVWQFRSVGLVLVVDRAVRSSQAPLDLGQQPGEIEPVGAGRPRRFQIGARPVAGFRRQFGIKAPGIATVAVMLMLCQEPRQVAYLGLRAGGE